MTLGYLAAIYILGRDYHSGSASRGYRLLCLSHRYLYQWYKVQPYVFVNWLYFGPDTITRRELRRAVAWWLWKLKDHRKGF